MSALRLTRRVAARDLTHHGRATLPRCCGFSALAHHTPVPDLLAGPFVLGVAGTAGGALVASGVVGAAVGAGVSLEFDCFPQPPTDKADAATSTRMANLMADYRMPAR
ncbi:MAG TPA: hypothetical protein VH280_24240 [Verrucomicrobiae bacterium]|nr:hypothetical protein [Verrucomicrobiae bacterium]